MNDVIMNPLEPQSQNLSSDIYYIFEQDTKKYHLYA